MKLYPELLIVAGDESGFSFPELKQRQQTKSPVGGIICGFIQYVSILMKRNTQVLSGRPERQPLVQSVINYTFLTSTYKDECPVLSLAIQSFHQQCMVSVLNMAELTIEKYGNKCLSWWDLNPSQTFSIDSWAS